ncbi:hypothetical protein RISK_005529 [Rhodopirellula islandica]|uniref:Uncharacterized protein n=1 Tax=Rhodopirellula islandica TaxID=595434 RepID=A0A0J1B7B2_RHOIS|nr:hypothetical protein RISK_005529 [Rhodopirellula islandica]
MPTGPDKADRIVALNSHPHPMRPPRAPREHFNTNSTRSEPLRGHCILYRRLLR